MIQAGTPNSRLIRRFRFHESRKKKKKRHEVRSECFSHATDFSSGLFSPLRRNNELVGDEEEKKNPPLRYSAGEFSHSAFFFFQIQLNKSRTPLLISATN